MAAATVDWHWCVAGVFLAGPLRRRDPQRHRSRQFGVGAPKVRDPKQRARYARFKEKPESAAKLRANRDRFHERHPDYKHRDHIKRRYGLTPAQYDALVELQGGRCAICRQSPTGKRTRLHVDHDHLTGEVRGLLCNLCNVALGAIHDDPAILRAAIVYLASEHLDVGIAKLI